MSVNHLIMYTHICMYAIVEVHLSQVCYKHHFPIDMHMVDIMYYEEEYK